MRELRYRSPQYGRRRRPRLLAEIAREAEDAGWDGVFIFDSLYSPAWDGQFPNDPARRATADPWVALAAMAMRTERVRLGTMITPVSRRRPWKLAREAVTLDHLSDGRFVLPVGLGSVEDGGYANVGEPLERRTRAEMLDEALEIISGLWSGEPFAFAGTHYNVKEMTFLPKPVQQPRIPIWVVGAWPRDRSMRRAVRWDGVLPVSMRTGAAYQADPAESGRRIVADGAYTGISVEEISAVHEYAERQRAGGPAYDIVIEGNSSGSQRKKAASLVAEYAEAGATWWIEAVWSWLFLPPQDVDRMRRRIKQGPPRE